ncbi:glycerol dehydrogenase Gcy1 [Penicillium malachiteum]|uniref:glycerol dehydrogenase Gcy1 n=1 Tax=Penicillium malachiteum TaxID=1324776 RepID=UPI0025470D96|nr:glycerol dehydrogenase Gcy1 [Penicillium malachiteum]KAJ5731799.1 glycerol dehydrogenase Gcy1 [Penicillium malachiteum]
MSSAANFKLNFSEKTYSLNTGDSIPAVGLGTWQSQPGDVSIAVEVALRAGGRHINATAAYGNEAEVGDGIKASGVPRDEIFLTTKLHNQWHTRVPEAIEASLRALQTDYVDLYLIHWPCSTDPNDQTKIIPDWDYINTWVEMQKLPATGKVKAIGVSNFGITHLERLLNHPSTRRYSKSPGLQLTLDQIVPAVNQIELHPNNPSPKLVAYNTRNGIHSTAYSCLGSTDSPLYKNQTLIDLAQRKGQSVQRILLKWGLQKGWSVIPKSVNPQRVRENFDINDWELTNDEIAIIDAISSRFKVCDSSFLPPAMHDKLRRRRMNGTKPLGPNPGAYI